MKVLSDEELLKQFPGYSFLFEHDFEIKEILQAQLDKDKRQFKEVVEWIEKRLYDAGEEGYMQLAMDKSEWQEFKSKLEVEG